MLKKIAISIGIICVILTGCGSENNVQTSINSSEEMGQSVEQKIEEEDIGNMENKKPISSEQPLRSVQQETYEIEAIHKAANTGDIDLVKKILSTEINVDERDSFGGTALHAAMFQEKLEIVKLLIDYGFDVNAQGTSNGYTPLHDAVWADNLEAAELLIEKGADISIKAKDGKTALDKAKEATKTDFVKLFEKNN